MSIDLEHLMNEKWISSADGWVDFDKLTHDSTRLENEIRALKRERTEVHIKLKALLASRMEVHRSLFEHLIDNYSDEFPKMETHGALKRWWIKGGVIEFEIDSTFRGSEISDSYTFPLRYLAADWRAQMAADAAAMAHTQQIERAQAEADERESELRELQRLQSKYGTGPQTAAQGAGAA